MHLCVFTADDAAMLIFSERATPRPRNPHSVTPLRGRRKPADRKPDAVLRGSTETVLRLVCLSRMPRQAARTALRGGGVMRRRYPGSGARRLANEEDVTRHGRTRSPARAQSWP